MKTSDIRKLGEAWKSVTSSQVELEDLEETKKEDIDPKLMAKAADAKKDKADGNKKPVKGKDDAKKTAPVTDKDDDGEGMDPVGKEDDDIDNDGDSDSTDKYLKKRRKAIGKAMDKEEPAESKKESVDYSDAANELNSMLEAAAKGARPQDKDATEPEEIDSKMSGKEKEFADKHKGKSDKKVEDNYEDGVNKTTKAGADATKAKSGKRPQDNQSGDKTAPGNPVKEDVDMDVKEGSVSLIDAARAALMGKTVGEMQMMIDKEKKKAAKKDEDKNPYDGRLKTAKSFLERMNKKHGYGK
jgi:hypothetical protein